MSSAFIGEIRAFGFNYVPRGWLLCDGAALPIRQYTALFSLLGTAYGGDGQTTFNLPDFTGNRTPLHSGRGAGPGRTPYNLGEAVGSNEVQLTVEQLPTHTHQLFGGMQSSPPDTRQITNVPNGQAMFGPSSPGQIYAPAGASPVVAFSPSAIAATGGGQVHENRQPLLVLNVCICVEGSYPGRN